MPIAVRCIIFILKEMDLSFLKLNGRMLEGKCPKCGFEIVVAEDY